MKERTDNYNEKPLQDFIQGDTIYIEKSENQSDYWYFCGFVKCDKGVVHAVVIEREGVYHTSKMLSPGDPIAARPFKCALWGRKQKTDAWGSFHRFRDTTTPAGEGDQKGLERAKKYANEIGAEAAANDGPALNLNRDARSDVAGAYGAKKWDLIPQQHREQLRQAYRAGYKREKGNQL